MKMQARLLASGVFEISSFLSDGGWIIECLPTGEIFMYESALYGGERHFVKSFPLICEAVKEAHNLT